jgi:hypothetical protein
MEKEIKELIERGNIRNALQRYARGVDRRDWTLVSMSYHLDAYDDHGGYKGDLLGLLKCLESRHAQIEQSMHFLGNCIIDFLSETVAVVETYCIVYQRYGEESFETIQTWLGDEKLPPGKKLMAELSCRYVDRFEQREGEWRIARRTVVMEEVKVSAQPVRLKADYALAQRDKNDPLWKALGQEPPYISTV